MSSKEVQFIDGVRFVKRGRLAMKEWAPFRYLVGTMLLFLGTDILWAAPGDLDPTFAGTGKTRFGFGKGLDAITATVLQPDGKIVAAGYSLNGLFLNFSVARYNADGSLDGSFGNSGKVVTAAGVGSSAGSGVALQQDGKIVVVGTNLNNIDRFAVVRYNPDGSLDTSFQGTGIVTTPVGNGGADARAVAIQTDGKIVVAGSSVGSAGNNDFTFVRYNTDGSVDTSINGTGRVVTSLGSVDDAYAVRIMSDGKILLAGSFEASAHNKDFALVRYLPTGVIDGSFGTGGIVITQIGLGDDIANAITIQPGSDAVSQPDLIIVAGSASNGTNKDFAVVRYNLNGTVNTSFGGGDGIVTTPIGPGDDEAFGVRFVGSGFSARILVSGYASNGSSEDFALARYKLDGTLDPGFNSTGIVVTSIGAADDRALAMTTQPDGKIILVGTSSEDFALVRYLSDGTLDTSFDGDGKRTDDIGNANAVPLAVAIQGDGRILIAGSEFSSGPTFSVARLNPDGSFDTSFDGDGRASIPVPGPLRAQGTAIALQADGKIVVAGSSNNFSNITVVRFNPDGSPDSSFGSNGMVTSSFAAGNSVGFAVAIQPDGKIVVAGSVLISQFNRDIALVRYNSNGTEDSSFNGTGRVVTTLSSGNDEATAIVIQDAGDSVTQSAKILVAGYSVDAKRNFAVLRYNLDGSLDNSFDGDGVVITPVSFDGSDAAYAITLTGTGLQRRIVVAGDGNGGGGNQSFFAVARYNLNGSLDTSFNGTGIVRATGGSAGSLCRAVRAQSGNIMLAGTSSSAAFKDFSVMRITKDGAVDSTYGNSGRVLVDVSGVDDSGFGMAIDANGRAVVVGESGGIFGAIRLLGDPAPPPTPTPTATPATLANISTRLRVETGDNVLIGGFIITGTQPKKVIIRGVGPSLNFADKLANPTLELNGPNGFIGSNDDWQNQPPADRQAVIDSTIPPTNDAESALVRTLPANSAGYTAIVRGANNATGIGVVEAYDLDRSVDSKLANISTRGLVQTGDNVLIAGTIILGQTTQKVIVRAIGPSLPLAGRLENPTLELRDQNGGLIDANDNWVDSPNKKAIIDSTIPPSNDLESAIVQTLPSNSANYTAILRGVNDTTGIAVVEIYALQ